MRIAQKACENPGSGYTKHMEASLGHDCMHRMRLCDPQPACCTDSTARPEASRAYFAACIALQTFRRTAGLQGLQAWQKNRPLLHALEAVEPCPQQHVVSAVQCST